MKNLFNFLCLFLAVNFIFVSEVLSKENDRKDFFFFYSARQDISPDYTCAFFIHKDMKPEKKCSKSFKNISLDENEFLTAISIPELYLKIIDLDSGLSVLVSNFNGSEISKTEVVNLKKSDVYDYSPSTNKSSLSKETDDLESSYSEETSKVNMLYDEISGLENELKSSEKGSEYLSLANSVFNARLKLEEKKRIYNNLKSVSDFDLEESLNSSDQREEVSKQHLAESIRKLIERSLSE